VHLFFVVCVIVQGIEPRVGDDLRFYLLVGKDNFRVFFEDFRQALPRSFAVAEPFVDFPASVNGGCVVMSPDDFAGRLEGVGFAPKGHYDLTG
jgi:hypothetical protein